MQIRTPSSHVYECPIRYIPARRVAAAKEVTTRMPSSIGIAIVALALGTVLTGSLVLGVALPPQANQHAVDATQGVPSGADVTGHPGAEENGVPPGPTTWLGDSAPYGPPEWFDESGGPPTWLTPP